MATTHQDRGADVQDMERAASKLQPRSGLTTALRLFALLAAMLATLGFASMAIAWALGFSYEGGGALFAALLLALLALLGMFAAAVLLFSRDLQWSIGLSAACAAIGLTSWVMLSPLELTLDAALGFLAFFVGPSLVVLGLCVWLRRRTAWHSDVIRDRGRGMSRRGFLALLTGSSILGALGYLGLRAEWPKPRDESVPDQPRPGVVIYDASKTGFAGWEGSRWMGKSAWKRVNQMLVFHGSDNEDLIGPFKAEGMASYAVEAEIRVDQGETWNDRQFGVVAQAGGYRTGYRAGMDFLYDGRAFIYGYQSGAMPAINAPPGAFNIAMERFPVDHAWHTYRFEAYGKALSLLIDGRLVAHTSDDVSVNGPGTGLFCEACQISVRSFKVIALS